MSKSVGNSVVRHQVVRRLRVLMPPILDSMPGAWIVVRAMPEAASASSAELQRDLVAAVDRLAPNRGTAAIDSAFAGLNVRISEPETSRSGRSSEQPDARTGVDRRDGQADPVGLDRRDGQADPVGLARVGWVIGTPLRWLLIGLVWTYRHTISPILPPTCRYHPSCSAYAFEALQVHGAAKGFVLSVWRVLRCNPFTPGGLDPVPARGQWRPDILPDGRPRTPAPASGSPA